MNTSKSRVVQNEKLGLRSCRSKRVGTAVSPRHFFRRQNRYTKSNFLDGPCADRPNVHYGVCILIIGIRGTVTRTRGQFTETFAAWKLTG